MQYLLRSSNNNMDNWQNPTKDQVTFMNYYIESLNTKEKHEYDKAVTEANSKGNVSYISCQYLNVPQVNIHFPLGFYRLLSEPSAVEGRRPRIIFVYGIEPTVDHLNFSTTAEPDRGWEMSADKQKVIKTMSVKLITQEILTSPDFKSLVSKYRYLYIVNNFYQ